MGSACGLFNYLFLEIKSICWFNSNLDYSDFAAEAEGKTSFSKYFRKYFIGCILTSQNSSFWSQKEFKECIDPYPGVIEWTYGIHNLPEIIIYKCVYIYFSYRQCPKLSLDSKRNPWWKKKKVKKHSKPSLKKKKQNQETFPKVRELVDGRAQVVTPLLNSFKQVEPRVLCSDVIDSQHLSQLSRKVCI